MPRRAGLRGLQRRQRRHVRSCDDPGDPAGHRWALTSLGSARVRELSSIHAGSLGR